ncbi:hypothetical protein M9435_002386 [Picochlorum sp. BPE23]|nr:hypothetical protein M9435_002386 [Picochlorum sp. BPE23]
MDDPNTPVIRPLRGDVVNKIAAGEIIQRPSNAVKELLENSIDAGATAVTVHVKDGGLKLLQVQDDGVGIRKDDLEILCQRHTTSKLVDFEDLQRIETLGFRGEALASMSYVSHLSVITKRRTDPHAWQAVYQNGNMLDGHPRPSAGVNGTTVAIDDLFFSVPMRKKAIKSATEEYNNILDVVGKYAVFHAGVSFAVKKVGQSKVDIQTQRGQSQREAIKHVFGAAIASNLREFKSLEFRVDQHEDTGEMKIRGYLTGPGYSGRKTVLVLFINGRAVHSATLKRCIESVYSTLLPKAAKPFVYVAMTLPPDWVDVNIHPTKNEVAFLHEEEIVNEVRRMVEASLLQEEEHRRYVQSTLNDRVDAAMDGFKAPASNMSRPDKMVRTDAMSQTLDVFLQSPVRARSKEECHSTPSSLAFRVPSRPKRTRGGTVLDAATCDMDWLSQANTPAEEAPGSDSMCVSPADSGVCGAWASMAKAVDSNVHQGLKEILRAPTVVGPVDDHRTLIQKGTRLYIIDVSELSKDLFYQRCIALRGRANRIDLSPGVSVRSLAMCALEVEEILGNWKDSVESGTKEEVADLLVQLLGKKAGFLCDNFGIVISESGELVALPELVDNAKVDPKQLPRFILSLGQQVRWNALQICLEDVSRALSELYMWRPLDDDDPCSGMPSSADPGLCDRVERHLVPAISAYLVPEKPRSSDGSIIELTRLEQLYRVFERC